jgi:hypothetical protein
MLGISPMKQGPTSAVLLKRKNPQQGIFFLGPESESYSNHSFRPGIYGRSEGKACFD